MRTARQHGFSLYQGLLGLTLVSIMFLCTAPIYYRLLSDRHVVAYTNELVGTLQHARHLAVNGMSAVSLCSSSNGRECTQTPWAQGYIAFYDAGQAGVVDGDDRVLRSIQPRLPSIRVVLNGAEHIRFHQNGAVLADASMRRQPNLVSTTQQTSVLASLWEALSPIGTAHADLDSNSSATTQSRGFLVCGGKVGRAIRVTAVGRLDTSTVACQ